MALILKPLGIRKKKSLKNGSLHPAPNTKMYSIIYELCFTKFKRVFCDLLIRFSLSIPKNIRFFFVFVFLTSLFSFFFKEGILLFISNFLSTPRYYFIFPNKVYETKLLMCNNFEK